MAPKSAIVFGASGVSGWAFVNQLLNDYPSQGTWGQVHALFNRPLSREKLVWPNTERLSIVSGVDLLGSSQEELTATLKSQVPGIEKVTHAYFLAYKASLTDALQEVRDNEKLLRQAITALDSLAPTLEFVVLQHGGRYYGLHLGEDRPTDGIFPPYKENMPMIPQPFRDELFYYAQLEWLESYAADKKWGWCETRPDIVIGFAPGHNAYNLAATIGVFCSLFREIHGEGAECPYPGTAKSWKAIWSSSSSDMLARQAIHVSLTPPYSQQKGEAYNGADSLEPSTWSERWPAICSYFGLKGVKLEADDPIEMRAFIKENHKAWESMEKKYDLQRGFAERPFQVPTWEHAMVSGMDFDRPYDVSKIYGTGFTQETTTLQTWSPVFERMRGARVIPSSFT
ncbi:SirQ [Colletotrichum orchidophilum]|uniref:SirQ n=1 Tax=Colletotrichum orchidophilum TaxID=1209926 RepID=A0A1G4APN5_9PEZI|nr:SirQ [Colletotrichum orchidophilum]OHE91117.1 SirQ [Colletotrichum orchidophilum]